jgi:uncharacterized Ntn-hydrolase superfamily protein
MSAIGSSAPCALAATLALAIAPPAAATFSISACDDDSCGVAVATNNLAVGATVIYAKAGVGAIATQFETNPNYGPRGLALLSAGATPERALATVLAEDGRFDGLGTEFRQAAIVAPRGMAATFSGREVLASRWAGERTGAQYGIVGNGLSGERVLIAMEDAFKTSRGESLALRLMLALEAGQAAGGQSTGSMSAALLVRTTAGGFADTDLRVDAAREPTRELRRLFDLTRAHAAMLQAERAVREGRAREATGQLDEALRLGGSWDRIVRRAARLSMTLHEPKRVLAFLGQLRKLNERWAKIEIGDPVYESLRDDPGMQELMR